MTDTGIQQGIVLLFEQRQSLRQVQDRGVTMSLELIRANIRHGIKLVFGIGSEHESTFSEEGCGNSSPNELLGLLDQLIPSAMALAPQKEDDNQLQVLDALNNLRVDIASLRDQNTGGAKWWDERAAGVLASVGADEIVQELAGIIDYLKKSSSGPSMNLGYRCLFIDGWISKICKRPLRKRTRIHNIPVVKIGRLAKYKQRDLDAFISTRGKASSSK